MQTFTREELELAKSVDLVEMAKHLGYTPKRIGRYYTLKEMDSIRIYDRSHWYRWSQRDSGGKNGGSQIDFLMAFAGLDIKESVAWLLDFVGYRKGEVIPTMTITYKEPEEKKPFVLPTPSKSNHYLYQYLMKERGLDKEVVDYFVNKGLIYEAEQYHNIVFKGNDKEGVTRFASMRGVFDRNGKSFKCDVAGNDKRYGFNDVKESNELAVFEAAIDLMSYVEMWEGHKERPRNKSKLALGMVSDAPLETFLEEHPEIDTIRFYLDNDIAGRKATEQLMEKYQKKGYVVSDYAPPKHYKDVNEWFQDLKKHALELENKELSTSR